MLQVRGARVRSSLKGFEQTFVVVEGSQYHASRDTRRWNLSGKRRCHLVGICSAFLGLLGVDLVKAGHAWVVLAILFLRLRVTLSPHSALVVPFRTHDSQFRLVNWLSVCFDQVARDPRDPQPIRCCSSHAQYRCDLSVLCLEPAVLRCIDTFVRFTRQLIPTVLPPACLLLVRCERQPNSQPSLRPKVSSACYLPATCARGLSSVAVAVHPACYPLKTPVDHLLLFAVPSPHL